MAYEVKLPDIGEGVAEGEIVRWMVKAGDAVKEDQPLVEVMTDKANVEIPSPRTGTIEAIHAEEGQVVPVGTVIVTIATAAGVSPPTQTHTSQREKATTVPTPTTGPAPKASATIEATPAVRALARQLGVALENVTGTGPNGRIMPDDVKAASGSSSGSAGPGSTAKTDGDESRIPLRGLRRKIAEAMRHSIDTAAHFTFVAECDMTEVVAHRESLKARAKADGVSLTYLAYVVLALVEPLRKHPLLNASLDDAASEIVLKKRLHLGIATATEEGLTVPVVKDADQLTLFAAAREIARLASAARERKLQLEELQGGTFTITSTGARGGLLATPILHHPQVAILGVHEVKPKPAVVDGQIVVRDLTNLSLSLDHRVVDGQVGADFLYDVIARLEKPAAWLTKEAIG